MTANGTKHEQMLDDRRKLIYDTATNNVVVLNIHSGEILLRKPYDHSLTDSELSEEIINLKMHLNGID